MTVLAWIVEALALLVVIVAHLFVIAMLLLGTFLALGWIAKGVCRLLGAGRVHADMSPHRSRGWQ